MDENLGETLMGGQSFSWRRSGSAFEAVLNGKLYSIKTIDDAYSDPFLSDYFDLPFDYDKAYREISSKDEILHRATESVGKLRILHQDPWITTVSFILSQNNNIKRITGLYDRLSEAYGKRIDEKHFSFPTPGEMTGVSESDLRLLGLGFRSPYIVDAVSKSFLLGEIDSLSYSEAKEKLMTIRGIGEKVASCILIYAYRRREGFPMDVWMKRVMNEYYPGLDASYFHPYEALSQQYLFSWIRSYRNFRSS